jgi:hypothetical protein
MRSEVRCPGHDQLVVAGMALTIALALIRWAQHNACNEAKAHGARVTVLQQQLAKAEEERDRLRERMDEALEHIHESRGATAAEPEPGADPVA